MLLLKSRCLCPTKTKAWHECNERHSSTQPRSTVRVDHTRRTKRTATGGEASVVAYFKEVRRLYEWGMVPVRALLLMSTISSVGALATLH